MIWFLSLLFLPAATAGRLAIVQSDDLAPYMVPVSAYLEEMDQPAIVLNLHGRQSEANGMVTRLRRERPDVVFCLGAKAAWAVKRGLPDTPMVYASIIDPGRYGIAGGQVTGIRMTVSPQTYLSQFVGFFPDVKRIGVLRGPLADDDRMAAIVAAAESVDVELFVRKVESPKRVRKAFEGLAGEVDAVWLQPDREMLKAEAFRFMADEARRRGLPLMVETENMVRAGAMFAVVPDLDGVGRQAARMSKLVVDGAAPAVIPEEEAQRVLVVLNQRTLKLTEIPFDELLLDFVDVRVE